MNFLEQLVAEWYEYGGYFVRTNVKFGRRPRGGYVGEMDVVCYNPVSQDFIHIETSTDADNWEKRKIKFQKKFVSSREYYSKIFPNQAGMRVKEIVVVGFNMNPKHTTPWIFPSNSFTGTKTQIIHIPKLFQDINNDLKNKNPQNDAIPETYPLLRAIQYTSFYNRKK